MLSILYVLSLRGVTTVFCSIFEVVLIKLNIFKICIYNFYINPCICHMKYSLTTAK